MSPSEALYVAERIENGWCPRERELADAECMLSDQLEAVKAARRQRDQVRDMLCPVCRRLLAAHKVRVVSTA